MRRTLRAYSEPRGEGRASALHDPRRVRARPRRNVCAESARWATTASSSSQLHGHEPAQVRELARRGGPRRCRGATRASKRSRPSCRRARRRARSARHRPRSRISWVDPERFASPVRCSSGSQTAAQRSARSGPALRLPQPLGRGRAARRRRHLPRPRCASCPRSCSGSSSTSAGSGTPAATRSRSSRRRAGRCPLVHVKDYASREGRDDVPVGDGIVGYERVHPGRSRGRSRVAGRRGGRGRPAIRSRPSQRSLDAVRTLEERA